MPQILTEVVARPPLGGAFIGSIEKLARDLSTTIEFTRPETQTRATHWLVLSLLVVVAAWLRLAGLGEVSLHGDEETMGLAVRGILEQGLPYIPSGMFYPRGLTQLYMMAGSVAIFGESEWALRLPSVICGVVLVPISFVLAGRFLRPAWALAFAGVIALLPTFLVDSQTARMYIFLVTFIAIAMVCLFAWERSGGLGWLVGGVLALVVGLDMHSLAVASMLMFMMPGLVRGDLRTLLYGSAAGIVVLIAFVIIDGSVNAQYPTPPAHFGEAFGPPPPEASTVHRDFPWAMDVLLGCLAAVPLFCAWRLRATFAAPVKAGLATACLMLAVLLQLALFYHLAACFLLAGLVLTFRFGTRVERRVVYLLGAMAVVLIAHVVLLAPHAGTPMRLVGALVGQPSVWPYVRIAQMSPVAGVLGWTLFLWGFYRLARSQRVTDYWVLTLLGVWAPVFALGLFAWDVPTRYTAMSLIPMLLCSFAFAQRGWDLLVARRPSFAVPAGAFVAAVLALLMVNPSQVHAVITAKGAIFPDHKGAADFIRQQNITNSDVVMAEDVLQQTFYLGRVDYWLIGPQVARRFVKEHGDGVVDFYTATPVIVTPQMLDDVLAQNRSNRVFIIGSGEDWRKGRREPRESLHEVLQSDRFETVFTGRDGRTRVLLAAPGASSADAAAAAQVQTPTHSPSALSAAK